MYANRIREGWVHDGWRILFQLGADLTHDADHLQFRGAKSPPHPPTRLPSGSYAGQSMWAAR